MNKKTAWMLAAALAALFLALTALVNASAKARVHEITCNKLQVRILDDWDFVSEEDIKGYIEKFYGSYIGSRLDSLELYKIESILDSRSAVLKSEAWYTDDGILHVSITQREPVARFEGASGSFYIDDRGFIFPVQNGYNKLLPVIDGDVPVKVEPGFKGEAAHPDERAWIRSILGLVSYMKSSGVWYGNIVQLHSDPRGELVLVPRTGREKIIFGRPEDVKDKFNRLRKYYEYVVPEKGEGYYSTVNVKYKGQIVCRK